MKICILHRYPKDRIRETNAAIPYLLREGVEVKTFKKFDRLNDRQKLFKSILWIFYAPLLVMFKKYDVIYCDDSFPFYPILVKIASPKSRLVLRIGDLHLMYYLSGNIYKFFHAIEKIGWRMADKILAISDSMAEYIYDEIKKPVDVILDPIEVSNFNLAAATGHIGKCVMFHGLITKNKGLDIVLDAARMLPGIDFWIVGDGPDLERLKSKATRNVWFTGWKPFDKISSYIATCDIGLAMRSDNPGNEYVVTSPFLQYSIMGKLCLVTKRRVFTQMNYPWTFESAHELVVKIRYLLDNPDQGKYWQSYVMKKHSAKEIGEQIWLALLS